MLLCQQVTSWFTHSNTSLIIDGTYDGSCLVNTLVNEMILIAANHH